MFARTLTTAAMAAAAVAAASGSTLAGEFNDRGVTAIWVDIIAYPDEGLWEACRRVYQHDVFAVRHGQSGQVRCKIDHSRLYDYSPRYRNYN